MTKLDPCRYCGKNDMLMMTERPFINVFTGEISNRVRIECNRCAWSVEAVVTETDRARVLWNAANRKVDLS